LINSLSVRLETPVIKNRSNIYLYDIGAGGLHAILGPIETDGWATHVSQPKEQCKAIIHIYLLCIYLRRFVNQREFNYKKKAWEFSKVLFLDNMTIKPKAGPMKVLSNYKFLHEEKFFTSFQIKKKSAIFDAHSRIYFFFRCAY